MAYFCLSIFLAAGMLLGAGCKKPAGTATPGQMPPVQVVAFAAEAQPVAENLSLVGTIAANEMVEVKAEIDGILQEILFKEGQRITKGDLLARLDETRLIAALAEAEANFKLSEANYQRAKQLFDDKLISEQEFQHTASLFEVNRAGLDIQKRQRQDARIYAPFDGIVSARNVSPGQVINKNTTLTWVINLDPVKVELNVPERFLSQLKVGQRIEMSVAAYPNRAFTGQVFFIAPYVDLQTRTALVKAEIPNPQHELKPGMFASLDLTLNIRENSIVVPESAISQLQEENKAVLFVVGADSTAQPRQVTLGVRLPGRVEILSGVKAGERVIVEGTQKISPGAKINPVTAGGPPPLAKPVVKSGAS